MGITTDRNDACLHEIEPSGMQRCYLVLSDKELARGFVRPVRTSYLHTVCQTSTIMGIKIAETYAHMPTFYGATWCCHCGAHFPVSEFIWLPDGSVLGS